MRIARALELNAINAMQVAQVLLKRVDKAAVNLTRMPELSHFSAGEPNGPGGEPWPLEDQLTLTVRGPLVHGDPLGYLEYVFLVTMVPEERLRRYFLQGYQVQ